MNCTKWIFLCLLGFSLVWSISALEESLGRPTGASVEVYLNTYSVNQTLVMNNKTEPGFTVGRSGYTVDSSVATSMLYLQAIVNDSNALLSDSASGDMVSGYIVVDSIEVKSLPATVCFPFLLLRSQRINFPFSLGIGVSNSIGFTLHYNCSTAAAANISLSLKISNVPTIECGWGKETSRQRLGFDVGSFIFVPDVAYNGVVLSDWAPHTSRIVVSAGVLSTPFNFWMSLTGESQGISAISFEADPPFCLPYLHQNEPRIITNAPLLALVVYNCSANGTTTITMTIELDNGFDPLLIQWSKQSGGYREFFMVGTQPGASDVIWWGLTLPLWSDYHFTLQPHVTSSTFYFTMNDGGDSQNIGLPLLSYNPDVADVQLSGDLADGGIVNNTAKSLIVTYNCLVKGQTHVKITIPIPGYESAVWRWTMLCGTIRNDFLIGTQPSYDDVVSDGQATLLYSPTLHTAFVFPDQPQSTFYLHLETPPSDEKKRVTDESHIAIAKPDVLSTSVVINTLTINVTEDSCAPFLTGNATVGNVLELGQILDLVVTYNCSRPLNTRVSVTIVLAGPFTPITFTWTKRVGKGPDALIIGTIENFDDVVSGGVPTPLYDPATFTAFYPTNKLSATFYAKMIHTYSKLSVLGVWAKAETQWCTPIVYSSWSSITSSGILTDELQWFKVRWNCLLAGKHVVKVTFNLENWGELVLAMTVYSGGPRPHLDIGTMKGASDVVMGGIPTPLWIPGPLNGARVSGGVLSTTFWIGLSKKGDSQLMSPPVPTYQLQEPIMFPYLTGTFSGGWVMDDFNSTLTIVYNCTGLGVVPISIGFLLPPYDSITFTWLKSCSAERLGLSIGTTKGGHDVVKDGEPTMAWNPLTHVAFVIGTELETRFWIELKEGSQLITNVTVNSSLPICAPYIIGQLHTGLNLTLDEKISFLVVYNCTNIGRTNIQVTIGLTGNYIPPSFMWTKRVEGQFSSLNVRTNFQNQANSDAIYQGYPTYQFDPISHNFITEQLPMPFYVSIDTLPTPLSEIKLLPSVAFSTSPWLLPDTFGPLSTPTKLPGSSNTSFSVDPHCLLSSDLLDNYATVFVAVTPVPFTPSLFAYDVDCPPNVPGLTVGFDENFSDVVQDGIPLPSWSPANQTRIAIEADFNILRFWVTADKPMKLRSILIAEDGIIITEPLGSADIAEELNQDIPRKRLQNYRTVDSTVEVKSAIGKQYGYPELPKPACRATLSGTVWDTMSIGSVSRELMLDLNCTIGGINNVSVILVPEDLGVSSTIWTFSKTMGGYRHGFDLVASPADFLPNASMKAVVNGMPTDAWDPGTTYHAVQKASSTAATFEMQLTHVYYGRDPLQDFLAPTINVSQPSICYPILLGKTAQGGSIGQNQTKELYVLTNCYYQTAVGQSVTMEISIEIPPFNAAIYAWNRESTGLPTYLSVDGALSANGAERVPLVRNGIGGSHSAWVGTEFTVWIWADRAGLPAAVYNSPNATLTLLPPMVNATVADCAFAVSGNATDGDELSLKTGYPLFLTVRTTSCNATDAGFAITLRTTTYATPILFYVSKTPPTPAKPKFPGLLVGIIIGSALLVTLAISIGLYLCLRRPKSIPSTGAYHMRRRKKEKQEAQVSLLSAPDSSEDGTIN